MLTAQPDRGKGVEMWLMLVAVVGLFCLWLTNPSKG